MGPMIGPCWASFADAGSTSMKHRNWVLWNRFITGAHTWNTSIIGDTMRLLAALQSLQVIDHSLQLHKDVEIARMSFWGKWIPHPLWQRSGSIGFVSTRSRRVQTMCIYTVHELMNKLTNGRGDNNLFMHIYALISIFCWKITAKRKQENPVHFWQLEYFGHCTLLIRMI